MVRAIALATLLLYVSAAAAADSPRTTVLSDLQLAFQRARALPLGSRPPPPPDLNINALVGAQPGALRASLGTPNYEGSDLDCGASRCWAFTYGPEPAPTTSERDIGDGRTEVVVSTGGPWLLLVAIDNDSVKTARWREIGRAHV